MSTITAISAIIDIARSLRDSADNPAAARHYATQIEAAAIRVEDEFVSLESIADAYEGRLKALAAICGQDAEEYLDDVIETYSRARREAGEIVA